MTPLVALLMCPDCHPGRVARAQILADGIVGNLLISLAPFLVVATILWLLHGWLDRADSLVGARRKS